MSRLNDKLEKIVLQSGLYFYQDEIEREFNITEDKIIEAEPTIQAIWDKLPDNANIAIYGLGGAYALFFGSIELAKKKVVCMIDNNPNAINFQGYPVVRSKDMLQYDLDIVMITSKNYGDEMESEVKRFSPGSKVINLWKEISSYGYFYTDQAIVKIGGKKRIIKAIILQKAIQSYHVTKDSKYLLYSIYSYLAFKDFVNAVIYVDQYISAGYCDADKMIGLKNDLLKLLDGIKQNLAAKKNGQNLMLIADSMRGKDLTSELCPFLFSLAQENINCTNAYVHMTWTTTSVMTTFKAKSFFDNHLYRNMKLTEEDYFFERIRDDGIEATYYCFFDKMILNSFNGFAVKSCPNWGADMIWQYICDAFESDKKSICFLHFGETHAPYFHLTDHHIIDYRYNENYFGALQYLDSQIQFLFSLLPENTRMLFCSDHGQLPNDSKSKARYHYHNDRCKTPYIICDKRTCGTETRIVSHLDTADILLNLLHHRPAFQDIAHRDYIEINEEFMYSELHIKYRINNPTIFEPKAIEPFKCFVTEKDKYVVFPDGEERYFLLPDDDTNRMNDPQYSDRINWFRTNVNTKFPDWSDDNGRYNITRKYLNI